MVDESLPIPVRDRLLALAPDQRAAAMAPPGPVLCVAPAGSGKTTTLVARIAWRIATGADPAAVTAIAFNRRAAIELAERLTGALGPLGVPAGTVLVRTFHALGLEILREAGRKVRIADRDAILRIVRPHASAAERAWLDTCVSRLKIEHGTTPAAIAADPDPGDIGRAFLDYQAEVDARGAFDFDDLLIEALRVLRADPVLLDRWQARCVDLLVDEAQDLDRVQLELALLLSGAPPAIFLVGDDDQSIYGWRLADVRRLLAVAADTPGLVRVDLEVNYRCPAPVVERAGRLVSVNQERLVKRVRPRAGATGWLALVRDGRVDHLRLRDVVARLPGADGTQAVLARTNRELLPAILVAVELDRPFRSELTLPVEAPWVDHVLSRLEQEDHDGPLLVVLDRVLRSLMHGSAPGLEPAPGEVDEVDGAAPDLGWESPPAPASGEPTERREEDPGATWPPGSIARALLGWAAGARDATSLARAVGHIQDRLRALRRPDASLVLSTAHATKGLEFDDVVVIMDRGRFPSPRSIHATTEPQRALEEERRLAYVAWTRARRSLTLIYDPAAPSLFLGEAFSATELGVDVTELARGPPFAIPNPVGSFVPSRSPRSLPAVAVVARTTRGCLGPVTDGSSAGRTRRPS